MRDAKTAAFIFCSNGVGLSRQLKNASKILPTVFPPRRGHLRLQTGIKDNLPQREAVSATILRFPARWMIGGHYAQLCDTLTTKETNVR